MDLLLVGEVVLVRINRIALAGSVVGVFVASTCTALTLDSRPPAEVVALPAFPPTAATRTPVTTSPPVTGAQLAALAAPPVERASSGSTPRRRAAAAPRATRAPARRVTAPPATGHPEPRAVRSDRLRFRELIRQRIEAACDDRVLRGPICRVV